MYFDYPIIDIHTHLRNNIPKHTRIAKESGIDIVVYMANCQPPLDNLEKIKPLVVGFGDDGQYLEDLNLLQRILEKGVLVLGHFYRFPMD